MGARNLPMTDVYGSLSCAAACSVSAAGAAVPHCPPWCCVCEMLHSHSASDTLPPRGHPCCFLCPPHSVHISVATHPSSARALPMDGGTKRLLSLSPTTLTAPFAIPDDTDASTRADPLFRVSSVQVCFCTVLPVQTEVPPPRRIPKSHTSDERSRSPLSIGALYFSRDDVFRGETIFV